MADLSSGTIDFAGSSALGTQLQSLLMADDIQPGSDPSYQLCKTIYEYHPLGAKMVESPVKLAMSQEREISIPDGPEECVRDAFLREWKALNVDKHIFNVTRTARMYGIAAIVYGAPEVDTEAQIPLEELYQKNIYFNLLDPLNTAGSLVLNQDPNSPDFQKSTAITAAGKIYHRSRSCVMMNESPNYISFTNSAFGFVGRSVYQRALFPLKSFVTSMQTDDMVQRKAGVLIAKMKPAGSLTDKIAATIQGVKRNLLKTAKTDNILSIHPDESIETLNLQNADTAMTTSRNNIIENIASSATMPPKLLLSDGYAGILANGTEDYKETMQYIQSLRMDMQALYDYFDNIVMYRAWNPDFYQTVQQLYPEYAGKSFNEAFFEWKNSFCAVWPSLLEEPDSEKIKTDEVKLQAIVAITQTFSASADPDNKAKIMQWAADNINSLENIFDNPLNLDYEALANYVPPAGQEPEEPRKPHFNL